MNLDQIDNKCQPQHDPILPSINIDVVDSLKIVSPDYGTIFLWVYKMSIKNTTNKTIKMSSRRWIIVDEAGIKSHSNDNNIVENDQRNIMPDETIEYGNFITLRHKSGVVYGECDFLTEETNEIITSAIPTFSLDQKGVINNIH